MLQHGERFTDVQKWIRNQGNKENSTTINDTNVLHYLECVSSFVFFFYSLSIWIPLVYLCVVVIVAVRLSARSQFYFPSNGYFIPGTASIDATNDTLLLLLLVVVFFFEFLVVLNLKDNRLFPKWESVCVFAYLFAVSCCYITASDRSKLKHFLFFKINQKQIRLLVEQ